MEHRRFWGTAILALAALAWPAFAGEIHDAVGRGDAAAVARLLAENPSAAIALFRVVREVR